MFADEAADYGKLIQGFPLNFKSVFIFFMVHILTFINHKNYYWKVSRQDLQVSFHTELACQLTIYASTHVYWFISYGQFANSITVDMPPNISIKHLKTQQSWRYDNYLF